MVSKPRKIEDVVGDYIVSTGEGKSKPSYETTNIWKNLPAVKNNNVIEVKVKHTGIMTHIRLTL